MTDSTQTGEAQADARQRTIRTLLQGLAVDVLVAVGSSTVAVLATINDDEILAATSWAVLGASVVKSGLTAIASYISRLKIPPTV